MSDEFSTYDAAYLLGALTPDDRQAYETHLQVCKECRQSVNRLAGMPGLLAKVPASELDSLKTPATNTAQTPVPQSLLPRLLAEVSRSRVRRRWSAGLLSAVAAACLAFALVLVFGLGPSERQAPAAEAMTPVAASPIRATASLDNQAWGTLIRVHCSYDGSGHAYAPHRYALVVLDAAGHSEQIATWTAVPGRVSTVAGSTSLPPDDIASVQVRTTDATPVLKLTP
ncbi:MAG: anti-sigma factor family protein [Nocardioidaceae bacterium]